MFDHLFPKRNPEERPASLFFDEFYSDDYRPPQILPDFSKVHHGPYRFPSHEDLPIDPAIKKLNEDFRAAVYAAQDELVAKLDAQIQGLVDQGISLEWLAKTFDVVLETIPSEEFDDMLTFVARLELKNEVKISLDVRK